MNPVMSLAQLESDDGLKRCCAAAYESDWARLLLGDSFHPGGLVLTKQLGDLLALRPEHLVLDIATGKGTSALFLARQFGCRVIGIDYSMELVAEAQRRGVQAGLSHLLSFEQGDAETLPFASNQFDAIICECALCTFPNKPGAVREFGRVLKPEGSVGLSDLTRAGALPSELEGLLAWVACLADARPIEQYRSFLEASGFHITDVVSHDAALLEKVKDVRTKLLGAELFIKLQQVELPGAEFGQAKMIARSALKAIQTGRLGYAIIVAANS